jgi:hypothetical protein
MPQHSGWLPLRGILATGFMSGFSAVNGTFFYNAADGGVKLLWMGALGGALVGTLMPFFKNDEQRIGWDAWDLSNTSYAEAPYTYTIKNGLNVAVDMAAVVGGVATGYGLYQLFDIAAIHTPLPEILYGASLWSATYGSVVYGGVAAYTNRHEISDFLERHCCCTSADQGLTAMGGQPSMVTQALLDPEDRLDIPADPASVNLQRVDSKV